MATPSTRARALSLYRKLLRSVRTWPGPAAEKQYIIEETRTQFRVNQHNTNLDEINSKIFEGESRHDIGWHYKIPYPRLHNFPTGSITENPSRIALPNFEIPSDEMASIYEKTASGFQGGWENYVVRS